MAYEHVRDQDIVKTLASKGYMVEPEALDMIQRSNDPGILEKLLSCK